MPDEVEELTGPDQQDYSQEIAEVTSNMQDEATRNKIIERIGDPNYLNFFRALSKSISGNVKLQRYFWKIIDSPQSVYTAYENIFGINEFFMHILAASTNNQAARAKKIENNILKKIISDPIKYRASLSRTGYINGDIINSLFDLLRSNPSAYRKAKALEILESVKPYIPLFRTEALQYSFEGLFEILQASHSANVLNISNESNQDQELEDYIESYRLALLDKLISVADERLLQVYIGHLAEERADSDRKRLKLLSIKFKHVGRLKNVAEIESEMKEIAKSTNQLWKPDLDYVNEFNVIIYLQIIKTLTGGPSALLKIPRNVMDEAIDHVAEKLPDSFLAVLIREYVSLLNQPHQDRGDQFNPQNTEATLKRISTFVSKLEDLHLIWGSIQSIFSLLGSLEDDVNVLSFAKLTFSRIIRELADPTIVEQAINILVPLLFDAKANEAAEVIIDIAKLSGPNVAKRFIEILIVFEPRASFIYFRESINSVTKVADSLIGEVQDAAFAEWVIHSTAGFKRKEVKINVIANIAIKFPHMALPLDTLIEFLQDEQDEYFRGRAARAISNIVSTLKELPGPPLTYINKLMPFLSNKYIGSLFTYPITNLLRKLQDKQTAQDAIDRLLPLLDTGECGYAVAHIVSSFVREIRDTAFIKSVLDKLFSLKASSHTSYATQAIEGILESRDNECLMPIIVNMLISLREKNAGESANISQIVDHTITYMQDGPLNERSTTSLISLLPRLLNNEENANKLIIVIKKSARNVLAPALVDNAINQLIIFLSEQKSTDITANIIEAINEFAVNYKGQSIAADAIKFLTQFFTKEEHIALKAIEASCRLIEHSHDPSLAEEITEQLVCLPQKQTYTAIIIKFLAQLEKLQNPIVTARAIGRLGMHLNTHSLPPTVNSMQWRTAYTISALIKNSYSPAFIDRALKFMIPEFQLTGLPIACIRIVIEYSELLDLEIIAQKLIPSPQDSDIMPEYTEGAKVIAHLVNRFKNPNNNFGKRIIKDLISDANDRHYNTWHAGTCRGIYEGMWGFLDELKKGELVDYAVEELTIKIKDKTAFREIAIILIADLSYKIQNLKLATPVVETLISLLCQEDPSYTYELKRMENYATAICKLANIVPIDDLNIVMTQLRDLSQNVCNDNGLVVLAHIALAARSQDRGLLNSVAKQLFPLFMKRRCYTSPTAICAFVDGPKNSIFMTRLITEHLIPFIIVTLSINPLEEKATGDFILANARHVAEIIAVLLIKLQDDAFEYSVLEQLLPYLSKGRFEPYLVLIEKLAEKPQHCNVVAHFIERLLPTFRRDMDFNTDFKQIIGKLQSDISPNNSFCQNIVSEIIKEYSDWYKENAVSHLLRIEQLATSLKSLSLRFLMPSIAELSQKLIHLVEGVRFNMELNRIIGKFPINKEILSKYPLYYTPLMLKAKEELSHSQITINKALEYFSYFHEDPNIRRLVSDILHKSSDLSNLNIDQATLYLLSIYQEFNDLIYQLATPNIRSNKELLIRLNAAEDDRNLADDGHVRGYWYSINDGIRLLISIRNKLSFGDKAVMAGEEYSATRENDNGVFLSDPYCIENFSESLADDIKTITGTHEAGQEAELKNKCKWSAMPRLVVIPFLSGMHWHAIRAEIDYDTKTISILYSDPYGEEGFHDSLIAEIEKSLVPAINDLVNTQTRTVSAIKSIFRYKKILDQQGKGTNNFDCGPVTFSNIRIYADANIANKHLYNTPHAISVAGDVNHEADVIDIRAKDINTYMEVSRIELSGSAADRIAAIQELLKQNAECELSRISKSLDSSASRKLASLTDSEWSCISAVIHENRIQIGHNLELEYSIEELSDAYYLVTGESLITAEVRSLVSRDEEVKSPDMTVMKVYDIRYENYLLNVAEGRQLLDYAAHQYGVSAVNLLLELGKSDVSANMVLEEVEKRGSDHVLALLTGRAELVTNMGIGITGLPYKLVIDLKLLAQLEHGNVVYATVAEAIQAGTVNAVSVGHSVIDSSYGSQNAPNITDSAGLAEEWWEMALSVLVAVSVDLATDPIM